VSSGSPSTEYYLDINKAGHLKRLHFAAFDGTNAIDCYSDTDLNDGLWHIVTVIKTSTSSHSWYIDGVAPASQPGATTITSRTYADNRYWGGYSNSTLKYTGDMAWLAVHDKALSGAEVQAIHAGGSVFTPTGTTCDYYSGGPLVHRLGAARIHNAKSVLWARMVPSLIRRLLCRQQFL
jgi:hypothetical protein